MCTQSNSVTDRVRDVEHDCATDGKNTVMNHMIFFLP